jgi:acetyltransferase
MGGPLHDVLNPRSIAIIGASEVPGKAAERRTRSLIQGGYRGRIYPINPKRETIFSIKAYPSVLDIDDTIDLAVVVIPPRFIPGAVEECARKGAKGVVIITAGLGETGEEGKGIEAQIMEIASSAGVCIIGPNCSGMFSGAARMNFLGIPGLEKGPYAVIAQSGNVIDSLSYYAKVRETGFSRIISIGNAIGVRLPDYLHYLREDPDTKVIMLYIEGITGGDKLIQALRETIPVKPVVALKVGRTQAGVRAAASHTGSLAGDDLIISAALEQAGAARVSNVDELFDIAEVLACCPAPRGNRVAIVSEGGGDNAIAADNAERHGLQVPILSREIQDRIRPFLLEGMPAGNPIDYGGTAEENPPVIAQCCRVCMESDEVDAIYVTGFFGGFKEIIASHVGELEEQTAYELLALVRKYRKPLLVNSSFARGGIKALEILRTGGIPVFESSERVAQGMAALVKYARDRERVLRARPIASEPN